MSFGIYNANPKAYSENGVKIAHDLDLAQGTDSCTDASVAAQNLKGIKYVDKDGVTLTLLLPTEIDPTDATAFATFVDEVKKLIKPYEHNIKMSADFTGGDLTFSHTGQSTISDVILGNDTDIDLTRA